MRGRAHLAAALAFALAPAAAFAEDDARAPVEIAGVVSQDGAAPAFFGPSGEIYEAIDGEDTWRRRALGGVAARVRGVVRADSKRYFAAGSRTPLYRRERGIWYAHPLPNRGRAVLSTGGHAVALGVGRHIYVFEDGEWDRRGRAPDDIAAIWAGDGERIYIATASGKLFRRDGENTSEIPHGLDDDVRVVSLIGRPGHELYAVSTQHDVLQVGPRRARKARIPSALRGARIDAAGYLPDGTPAVAAAIPAAIDEDDESEDSREEAPSRVALATLRAGEMVALGWLPDLEPGDRVVAISSRGGAPALATARGRVVIRDGDGWRKGRVSAEPPERIGRARGSGPARSR